MSVTFEPQNTKGSAIKRIMRDLRDLEKAPIAGLAVTCPDESNPFVLHCNVLINDGPYRGILIHLILNIPEDYPLTGPAGNIAPGLEFDSTYHSHIHEDGRNGHALCNDLLTNYAGHFQAVDGGASRQASGWSPGYTLSTALLQIVTFFAEPDLRHEPTSSSIARLRSLVKEYRCRICEHCFEKPNPPIIDYSEAQNEKLTTEDKSRQQFVERLTCGVTKQNIFEDPICLGYPLLIKRDRYGRLWPEIVLELISYDAYVAEIQKTGQYKLDFYENARFRSVTGKDYNHWLPIFINEQHFQRGKTYIENSLSIIQHGTAMGNQRYDFTPSIALDVLTTLMNKSTVQLFNGQMFQSKHAIEAYCHFLRLLMHFLQICPELERRLHRNIEDFLRGSKYRNKKAIPDIGEFLIQVALSRKYQLTEIKQCVYEEYFARQIYWINQKSITSNLFHVREEHLMAVFSAAQVSNHLLVFNLEMAKTFIIPGVKEALDRSFGHPPDHIVDAFQQRLREIKTIDRYSTFLRAIHFDDIIKSPEEMLQMIRNSIRISNRQGYTNISESSQPDRTYERRRY